MLGVTGGWGMNAFERFWHSELFIQLQKWYKLFNYANGIKATVHVCSSHTKSFVPLYYCYLAPLRYLFTNTLKSEKGCFKYKVSFNKEIDVARLKDVNNEAKYFTKKVKRLLQSQGITYTKGLKKMVN